MPKSIKMEKDAASRIYSANAKEGNGNIPKGDFAARAKSAADKNSQRTHAPIKGKVK